MSGSDAMRPPPAFWGYGDVSAREIPQPPYQVLDGDFFFVGVRWSEETIRSLLPTELTPTGERTGVVHVFRGNGLGPITPFTACFFAIEVEGFDSPDGSRANYIVTGHCDGRAGTMYRRFLNANFLEGGSRQGLDDGEVWGIGGPPGRDGLRVRATILPSSATRTTGIHNFLGPDPQGAGIHLYPVAFTGEIVAATPIAVDILPDASDVMQAMQPEALLWSVVTTQMSITYGAAQIISERESAVREGLRVALLEVFSHIGRAAAIVRKDGQVAFINRQAESLLGDGLAVENGRLRGNRDAQALLLRMIGQVVERGNDAFALRPIAIKRSSGGRPIIAHAMPIDPAIAGRDTALVLFSDPASESSGNPVQALQLLGLTPAEARIAALVGAGLAPKEAAAKLGNSEGTVRTALTQIYQKLDIGRQSELAKIVARLETIG